MLLQDPNIQTPTDDQLWEINALLHQMQNADLPLEKVDLLIAVAKRIVNLYTDKPIVMCADYYLPILIYVVARTGFIAAEIEAEFCFGLLHPSLYSSEAGYHLTSLCSAVQMLKSYSEHFECSAVTSTIKVMIPDECNDLLQVKKLPIRQSTTVKDICRTIAHKARVANSQDYALFQLVKGEEILLQDNDYVANHTQNKCVFAYKRIDAKIAWPTHTLE